MCFPELNLEGQVAIVTGAGRGIGRAVALTLAEAGADLVVCSRTKSEIQAVADEVREKGRRALALPIDVAHSAEVDHLVGMTLGDFGKIDILVNNVGQFLKVPVVPLPDKNLKPPVTSEVPTERLSDSAWCNLIEVNLNSMFYFCRAVGPHMIERGRGKIVNVSSNSAVQGAPFVAPYNCSKAAVNMLTKVLALEWAEYGICVNALAPGEFHTSLTDFSWSDAEQKRRRLERIPMHREGDLRHLGILAAYLASSAADYVTGQVIHMDGGLTAR